MSEKNVAAEVRFAPAAADELPAVKALLRASDLPCEDLQPHFGNFLVARFGGEPVAVVGAEYHGRHGLLRSLCVSPAHRGRRLASKLCDQLEESAFEAGIAQLHLLTTTAENYFARRGFTVVSRDQAPPEIQATAEFSSLCPESAVCMVKSLAEGASYFSRERLKLRPDVSGAAVWGVGLDKVLLTYFEVPPGVRFEAHDHEGEQITSVTEGELFFEIGGRTIRVGKGEAIAIPPGVSHAVFTRRIGAKAFDAWSPPFPEYC